MLYFKRQNLGKYMGFTKNLDTALQYLATKDLTELAPGRNEVDGENVFINRMSYTTMTQEEAFYEAHLQYIDIHVLIEGQEYIGVSDIHVLEEFDRDENADFVGYQGMMECKCAMDTTNILVVFPEDAHMVKVMFEEPDLVEKIVVKVKI